jgi:hypothetical protein
VAEAAAGDKRESFDALRELVEELHRHATAERVPDDARTVDPDRRHQVADACGMCAQRVVAARGRRVAVPDQVGCEDRVVARQVQRHRLPVAGGVEHAVDQHDGGPAAGDPVDGATPVQRYLPLLELRGGCGYRHGTTGGPLVLPVASSLAECQRATSRATVAKAPQPSVWHRRLAARRLVVCL